MNSVAKQPGFTLIEVLVTLLIVAIGLLGLGALQVSTINDQFEANQKAYATWMVDDMADRIRANGNAASDYIGTGFGTKTGAGFTSCSAITTTAQRDLCHWNSLIAGSHVTGADDENLGSSLGAVGCVRQGPTTNSSRSFRVVIAWQGVKASAAPNDKIVCGKDDITDATLRRVVFRDVYLR